MQALYGITDHRFDPKMATLVLAALEGARRNLRQMEECVAGIANVSSEESKRKRPSKVKREAAGARKSY